MKTPPDPRRTTTSRPLAAPSSQPTGAPRSNPLTTGSSLSRPTARPRSQPLSAPLSQPRRLPLSELIDDRIEWISARERQRAWLVTTVVLAQSLITLIVAPGYLIPSPNLPMLVTLAVALVFYIAAFIFNRVRHELRVAIYMLVGGGVLATAAQTFVTALLTYSGAHTAQTALLFLPISLEAGLFLTPELTLFVASAAAVLTASAILLALALASDSSGQLSEAYLVMVYSLGLEVFIGYLAWRLAQFIYETVKSAQADEDLRFAQARLAAVQRQIEDQRRQLTQDVGAIQMAVASALAHEYDARIDVAEGDLAPLAASMNLVIEQLRSTNELERRLQRMEAQAVPLIEAAGRLANGAAPIPTGETPTDTALYSLSVALNQAQVISARRQMRLQELAAEIANTLRHSREGLANAPAESASAQQLVGQLIALAETLTVIAQRQADLLAQARRALALVLPPEVVQGDLADASLREPLGRDAEGTNELLGLGPDIGIMQPGLTGQFNVYDPIAPSAAGIPPLTTPLPAVKALTKSESESESEGAVAQGGELPAGLADAWLLLTQLQAQTANESRSVASLSYDLGMLKRHVRLTGLGIDWINQALNAVESHIERLQQLASASGATADLMDDTGAVGLVRPAMNSMPRPAPLVTRPLEAGNRLPADPEAAPPSQPSDQGAAQRTTAAPGSLRVSDLIGFDALRGQGGPATPEPANPLADPRNDADPRGQ